MQSQDICSDDNFEWEVRHDTKLVPDGVRSDKVWQYGEDVEIKSLVVATDDAYVSGVSNRELVGEPLVDGFVDEVPH